MKIKNIRQYRTFYKENVRDLPNRNEHNMGTFRINEEGKKEFGWFEVYHGDKEGYGKAEQGIGNFLQSFLDMAKDGQAVYEFLQNAVDASASHFTMAWGKDQVDDNNYVLIANNGKMFDFDSIRSILNVGSSTKLSDSQSIGKFGIGFKLAHRLVGKENGLDELLSSDPSGPILFSWKNGEIQDLAKAIIEPKPSEIIFDSHNGNYKITDDNPWLFKILITCFPALPENELIEEMVILADGEQANTPVFQKAELNALHRWVANYSEILNSETYKEGALFFIKLGTGKENDLADKNLAEGVKFSLAILQETAEADKKAHQLLSTVQLNKDEPILKPDLHYHFFKITKNENTKDYLYVRFGLKTIAELTYEQKLKYDKEDDIEVLFGFIGYDEIGDYFKGAPNFYLYFPLSEEVHNFNFVLHSNAFYKASSRTFLHKGTKEEDGINERLLRVIAERLEQELESLYICGEYKKFLDFYAALLTSSESQNYEREWIKEPFIDKITIILKKLIPVRKTMSHSDFNLTSHSPKIKKTNIVVPSEVFGTSSFNWFYWGPDAPEIIIDKAFQKLNPKSFDIFILLRKQNIYNHVNEWIENDKLRINLIFDELQIFNKEKVQSDNFKNNLKALNLFEFSDGQLLSDNDISEVQDEGYLILHNNLSSIKDKLNKIGLKTSLTNLDDYDFFRNYGPYLNTNGQLRSQAKIIEIISNGQIERLYPSEKLIIFTVLRDMIEEGRRKERLLELKLFKNSKGNCVKIKHLLKSTEKNWLEHYVIHPDESFKEIEFYLESDESRIYLNIIKPFWTEIGKSIIAASTDKRKFILSEIEAYFQLSDENEGENLSSGTNTLFFQGEIKKTHNSFYQAGLRRIPENMYKEIQVFLDNIFNIQIPDSEFLFAYEHDCFNINDNPKILSNDNYHLTDNQISLFLQFVSAVGANVFEDYCIAEENNIYILFKGYKKNYYSKVNKLLEAYMEKYNNKVFIKLPNSLSSFGSLVKFKDEALYNELIKLSVPENTEELIEVISSASLNIKIQLFNKLSEIRLQYLEDDISSNKSKLEFIAELTGDEGLDLKMVQDKIKIQTESNEVALSDIDIANDQIKIEHQGNQVQLSRSKLLNLENEKAIPTILSFAKLAIKQSLLTERAANKIFKISSDSISDKVIERVIYAIGEQGNAIRNADQLILLINLALDGKICLNDFRVENIANKWVPFKGNFLILDDETESGFYRDVFILSKRYNDFKEKIILRLGEVYSYVNIEEENSDHINDDLIYTEFTFQQGITPEVLRPREEVLNLLDFLLEKWSKTPTNSKIKLDKVDWSRLLGFNPSNKVLSSEVLESEVIDDSIIEWINNNKIENERFFSHVGGHGSDSKITKFRKWIIYAPDVVSNPVTFEAIPLHLISNTLVGLADGFFNKECSFQCNINSDKHLALKKLIEKILESNLELEVRLPLWKSLSSISLGDETDNFPYYIDDDLQKLLSSEENKETFSKLIEEVRIIYPSKIYETYVKDYYSDLITQIVFHDCESRIEHSEPFYLTWSKENKTKLYRCDRLLYEFSVDVNDNNMTIGYIEAGNVEVHDDENGQTIIYYQKNLSLELLSKELTDLEHYDKSLLLNELIETRDKMLSAFYHALTSSGRDDFDSEDSKRILDVLNERGLDEERSNIIKEFENTDRYSYNWFKGYIDYLLTFEELADTISQKTISFQKIEKFYNDGVPSKKYFTLRGANSLIPLNIEIFENFSISIVFARNQRENLLVEGVSKKGQDLLVYVPQGINEKLASNLDKVVNISISFTPVLDLLQRLANVFSNEEIITPWENIEDSLPPLHFIYGPPGTGKTTKLVNILLEKFDENFNFKALILVPTNKAGDVLAKKIVENNNEIGVLRIGGPTDPELEKIDKYIYQTSVDEYMLDSNNVIISTIHRLPYYQISVEHGANFKLFDSEKTIWDLVIFDESSMINLPYFAFALHALSSKEKIIIAGDPKQIPAVVDVSDNKLEELEMADESIYKMLKIESFDEKEQNLRNEDSIDNLNIQYRCVEVIGDLFSTISYNSLLKHGRDFINRPVKELPLNFYGPLKSNISFIDLPIDESNSILAPRKLLYSPYHVYAGIAVTELISNLDKCNVENNIYSIGVISPYKAQAMLMNKLITSAGISDNITVFCDTVHGFQGDECDIVIFVVNPNNTYYTGHPKSLLSKEYIYNVAISRAKDYLWIFCPFNTIKNNPHVNKLIDMADNDETFIQSKELEKYLFDEDDFIVKKTFLTGHDNINVYSPGEMSYFIKAGTTAIDIQLNK